MAELNPSPLALMEMQAAALFIHDADGRLLTLNDWERQAAPRFFLGRTPEGNIWRFRYDLAPQLVNELEDLCRREPVAARPPDLPYSVDRYQTVLAKPEQPQRSWSGPAYALLTPSRLNGSSVLVTTENCHLLEDELDEWLPDVEKVQPMVAVIQDGKAVSLCASVRITETAHEAGVETVAAYRRRGLAACAVARWSYEVTRLGAIPLYSTSWSNGASQAVARRCGFRPYGVDFHIS